MNGGEIIGLVFVALLGGSLFILTAAYAHKKFVAPTLVELFGRSKSKITDEQKHLEAELAMLTEHLHLLEERIDRIDAATQFDRQLREATGPEPKTQGSAESRL